MSSNGAGPALNRAELNGNDDEQRGSLIRRSWHAMADIVAPFSPSALAALPKRTFARRPRYTRADNVPEAERDEHGQMPTVRDYHAINSLPPQVRVPKKIATPIKVEGKVWFANERSERMSSCDIFNESHGAYSLDIVPEHRSSHCDPCIGSIQRVQRSNRSRLRVYLCSH